ncbi:ABC transporter substrate-binding protein [Streptomyces sp. NPDC057253]|uniref:ABC transporter substrate-binding protein n=1 Tax=Streptomyces sp. NPDC057253 TaxID=3346069 RepID=UPI003634618D
MELSRRGVLRTGALGGAALLSGGLLSACAGGANTGTGGSGSAGPTGAPKRGGTFVHGISGGSSKDSLSAFVINSASDFGRFCAMYETLWFPSADYTIQKKLVDEYSVNKAADEWTIRLKSGVEFHNGKKLTAEDVLHSFTTLLDPKTAAAYAGSLSDLDLANSRKVDELTVRLKLKSGLTNLPEILSTFIPIIPVGYDPAKPVGTGPFKLKSFEPGRQTTFTRHENYWQHGKPYLDSLTIIDFADESSRVNALLSGQVTGADTIEFSLLPQLQGKSGVSLLHQQTNSFVPLQMRTDKPPFDDPRVRQAFRLLVDRKALNEASFLGHARIANDLYAPSDPLYDASLPQREQDVAQAKYLLKQAGAENLKVTLTTADLGAGIVSLSQAFAEQAKRAGVTVTVDKVDQATFYGPNYGNWLFSPNLTTPANYFYTCQSSDAPTSTTNFTHFKDAEFDSLYRQAVAETDTAKQKELAHRMQKIQYDRGGYIIAGFYDAFDGHSNRLGGLKPDVSGLALYRYADLWLA